MSQLLLIHLQCSCEWRGQSNVIFIVLMFSGERKTFKKFVNIVLEESGEDNF